MHDDSFLPWALYGNSACIVVPLPQRFREHSWLLPELFPRGALVWKTRSASIDTNETSKELLFFSHDHRKKSCSTAGCCFFCEGIMYPEQAYSQQNYLLYWLLVGEMGLPCCTSQNDIGRSFKACGKLHVEAAKLLAKLCVSVGVYQSNRIICLAYFFTFRYAVSNFSRHTLLSKKTVVCWNRSVWW